MTDKLCKLCGQPFRPKSSRQQCCNQPKTVKCAVCGELIEILCTTIRQKETCSDRCSAELIKIRRTQSSSTMTKECKWCGQLFVPKTSRDVYCSNAHYKVCEVCGNSFEIDVKRNPYVRVCSSECKKVIQVKNRDFKAEHEKQKEVLLQKYGVDNAMKIPGVIDSIRETNQSKYGADWYTQTQEYKDSVQQTSRNRYGVEHFLKSDVVIEKRNATVQEKYGVANVFQTSEVKEKSKETLQSHYGVDNISQSPEIQDAIRNNNMKKYGVTHPMMLQEFQDKAKATNMEKYGRVAYTQQHINNIQDWYLFIDNPETYILHVYGENKPTTRQLAEDLGVDVSIVDVYLNRNGAFGSVSRAKSLMEEEITSIISSWLPSCKIINNTRSVIEHNEIDIYLPEFKEL